jgi:hypothetical protein
MQRSHTGLLLLLSLSAFLSVTAPAGAQAPGGLSDDNGTSERIEYEIKLKILLEQRAAVLEWLQRRYADCSWLERDGHVFSTTFGNEDFTDIYFDTPDLQLLAKQSGVRHRTRRVRTGPAGGKDGRQLLQIKLNRGDATGLARSEVKFNVSSRRKSETLDDAHAMLGLVTRDQRQECKAVLNSLGIDPYMMRPILTLKQNRQRVYLSDQKGALATLTLDLCSTTSWRTNLRWLDAELELNEIRYTAADKAEQQAMERVIATIQADLQQAFPSIVQDQTPKYNVAFASIKTTTWMPMHTLIRWGVNADDFMGIIMIGVLAAGGALLYVGTWWRRRAPRKR